MFGDLCAGKNTFKSMVRSWIKYEKRNFVAEMNFGRTLECWILTSWFTFTFKVSIGDIKVGDIGGH